jgi:glycosyltransferase involved in cell wall biosynthesis
MPGEGFEKLSGLRPVKSDLVSVVVPVRNGAATLGNCLRSLLSMDFSPERREIIVVDNGSTDGTADIIKRFPVRCVREHRRGLSHARNRGIEASRGWAIAFTDSDCYVDQRWLSELLAGLTDGISATSGEIFAYLPKTPAERYAARRKPLWHDWTLRRSRPWFLFGNAVVTRDAFERVGRFDTSFVGGSEDIDFCWRFHSQGLVSVYRPSAAVFHHHRVSSRSLFRQHVGYGRGQRMLLGKYPDTLSWGWRDELRAWMDLGGTANNAIRAWCGVQGTDDRLYPALDLVRKSGQRFGFVGASFRALLSP